MAYNPFDFFRRNQKTFFAILTVVVMFMFVLQFGPGDFFSKFPKWFGGRSGTTLAVIDGSKYSETDMQQRRVTRRWANDFLHAAHSQATFRAASYVMDGTGRASADLKPHLQNLIESRMPKRVGQNYVPGTDYIPAQMWEFLVDGIRRQQVRPEMIQQFRMSNIRTLDAEFVKYANSKTAKSDDVELATAAVSLMRFDLLPLQARDAYLGTVDLDDKGSSVVEFELWLKKADKLGVVYTRADAESLVQAEFNKQFSTEDWLKTEAEMMTRDSSKGFTRDKLRDALIDELKVRTAMTVVLGPVRGNGADDPSYNRARQDFATAYEQFEFYKKQCNQTTYAAISVPVANFLDQVKGEPTVAELNDLFKKYRVEEPAPNRELPGFKEPRKLKVEWLEAKGDEAYFKAKAKEYLPKLEFLAQVGGMLTVPTAYSLGTVLGAGAPLGIDRPAFQSAYQEYARQTRFNDYRTWFPEFRFAENRFTDQSVVRPEVLAATAIAAAASRATLAGPFDAVVTMHGQAMKAERDAQIKAGASLLFPATPITPYVVFSQAPQPLALPVVSNDLKVKVLDHYARQIAFDDLTQFEAEVKKLGATKDKAPAQEYVEKFAKDRGLKTGGSTGFFDVFSISQDPGLKPLLDRAKPAGQANVHFPIQFGQTLFMEPDFVAQRMVPATSFYAPVAFPEQSFNKFQFVGFSVSDPAPEQSTYFVWRTVDQPAEAPKTIDDKNAREKVIAAWRRIKARELAKARAEALAKEAGQFGNSPTVIHQKLLDAHAVLQKEFAAKPAQDKVKFFYFPPVAELMTGIATQPGRPPEVTTFQVKADENVPFPEFESMRTELLGNRDKPLATALVLADQPKDTFYVAVLETRDTKGYDDFGRDVYDPSPLFNNRGLGNEVLGRFAVENDRKTREDAVALLKAEFRYEKEHPDLAKKSSSSD